ncbi:MAG: DNA primase [Flavobacteriaceae bacterium]|nr:MAG: DNA primase [Flavobacteriaceae bacterium]
MISKVTIDKVFQTALVEEVVGDFIQLKKSGSNYKGLSPFTNEKTPSFMVSPTKQIWKDFSSGKGGNVIAFLMEHEQYSYPQAIRYLADKYNIEIIETELTDKQKDDNNIKEKLFLICDFVKNYFKTQFNESDFGRTIARTYFDERGFDDETLEKFDIGSLGSEKYNLRDYCLLNGYDIEDLEALGLVSSKNQMDIYRSRLIFPIKSISGRTIGFGARILDNNKKSAKYINSPESKIYNKSNVLFGLYNSKNEIVKKDSCLIAEGYTDVMRFHQIGINNIVSSSGTALTVSQISLIRRLTKNVTMLFDSDKAGVNATERAIELLLSQGMNIDICILPDGEDPDSFGRNKTYDEINNYVLENSVDFIQFKSSMLGQSVKNSPSQKTKIVNEIINLISKVTDPIKQEIYIKDCSLLLNISEAVLFNSLAQIKHLNHPNKQFEKKPTIAKKSEKLDQIEILEEKIIEILLLYGNHEVVFDEISMIKGNDGELTYVPTTQESKVHEKIYLDLQADEIEFANEDFKKIYKLLIDDFQKNKSFDLKTFINNLSPNLSTKVTSIVMNNDLYHLHNWQSKNVFVKDKKKKITQLVTESILTLRTLLINKKVSELSKKTKESSSDEGEELLEEIVNYYQLKSLLSKKLNRVI